MNQQEHTNPTDDTVQGHSIKFGADAESAEGDQDTEGHYRRYVDAETAEGDDNVEAHAYKIGSADAEFAEGDDNVEGHVYVEEPHSPNDHRN
jgi:hypothetical protein